MITGASSGIGRAVALRLASAGATVCALGRSSAALQEVVRAAENASAQARSYAADLTDDAEIERVAEKAQKDWGRLDILVHSAATITMGPISDGLIQDFDRLYSTNLRAPYLLTRKLLPLLKVSGGQVVFMNSSAGVTAKANFAQYAATKHGLRALADSLRDETNECGVRVMTLFLGRTATTMQQAVHAFESKEFIPESLMQPDDVASITIAALSLNRTAEVTDITIRPFRKPGVASKGGA